MFWMLLRYLTKRIIFPSLTCAHVKEVCKEMFYALICGGFTCVHVWSPVAVPVWCSLLYHIKFIGLRITGEGQLACDGMCKCSCFRARSSVCWTCGRKTACSKATSSSRYWTWQRESRPQVSHLFPPAQLFLLTTPLLVCLSDTHTHVCTFMHVK